MSFLLLFGFQRTNELTLVLSYFSSPLLRISFDLSKLNRLLSNVISFCFFLLRKEVIHPHVPVGIPCYDLTLIISPTFDGSLYY